MTRFTSDGLFKIDKRISIALLAQRLSQKPVLCNVDAKLALYAEVLKAFELLCNMNLRDRDIARRILTLDLSLLKADFPCAISALVHWAKGDLSNARYGWVAHLQQYPDDIVGSFMLHMFDFLYGNPGQYGDYLKDDARCDEPVLGGYYQGILAFSLCEQGSYVDALPLALEANRKNADDIYSLHALVHAWHGAGNHQAIVDHLQRNTDWEENVGMNIHVKWHLAVALLEVGQIKQSALTYHSFRLLTDGHHAEQDLDAVNYCIRLYCSQLSRPIFAAEYALLARNWAPSIYNSLSYFNDLHAAIAFMLAGDSVLLKKLKKRPPHWQLDDQLQLVGQQIIDAVVAFSEEDYLVSAAHLQSSRPLWYRIGGSRAQREILEIMLETALHFACGSTAHIEFSATTLN